MGFLIWKRTQSSALVVAALFVGSVADALALVRAARACALVTRVVKPKSKEADCEGAREAIRKELAKMNNVERPVWDVNDVYSLADLYKDPNLSEAMLGRVFAILGIKGAETQDPEWKGRIVFQGSNIRTKTGVSAVDLFEEVANAPASFAAARTALAVGALKGMDATLRDAEAAYLQALIDATHRVPTFVELPREWWPDSWFHDGSARQHPKYVRPHCRLLRALYGHPGAGALWEARLNEILGQEG